MKQPKTDVKKIHDILNNKDFRKAVKRAHLDLFLYGYAKIKLY